MALSGERPILNPGSPRLAGEPPHLALLGWAGQEETPGLSLEGTSALERRGSAGHRERISGASHSGIQSHLRNTLLLGEEESGWDQGAHLTWAPPTWEHFTWVSNLGASHLGTQGYPTFAHQIWGRPSD